MTIIEFIKNHPARIVYEDKWLINTDGDFSVYRKEYGKRATTLLYTGNDDSKAVEHLISGD
jgi:hypothetical protein